jgi:hypothetical protein
MNEVSHQVVIDPLTFNMIALGVQRYMALPDSPNFKAGDKILISPSNYNRAIFNVNTQIEREIELVLHGDGFPIKEGFCILQIS